jgi:hypothetical protein
VSVANHVECHAPYGAAVLHGAAKHPFAAAANPWGNRVANLRVLPVASARVSCCALACPRLQAEFWRVV